MHKLGDTVEYEGEEVTIVDIAVLRHGDSEFTSLSNGGMLQYQVEDSSGERFWEEARFFNTKNDEFFGQDDRSPELIDRGYNMVAWSDGLEDRPDNSNLPAIVTLLMAIQYDKEGSYGSSWKGKGEYRGIMANIDRKYDRLDKMTDDEIAGSIATLAVIEKELESGRVREQAVGESKIDAIADLANYCLLYLTYVKEKYPRVFRIWVDRNVPKYLADKIPFI